MDSNGKSWYDYLIGELLYKTCLFLTTVNVLIFPWVMSTFGAGIIKMIQTLFYLLILFLTGCAVLEEVPTGIEYQNKLENELSSIDFSDGVSAEESNSIVQAYFYRFGTGCGAALSAIDQGEAWKHPVGIGIAGTPTDPIFINKKTGEISWAHGPIINNPQNIFEVKRIKDPIEIMKSTEPARAPDAKSRDSN